MLRWILAEVILSPRIKMVFVDAKILETSTRTFKQYSSRNLSFTDAVSIEIMNELGIQKYLGFDAHFNGIARMGFINVFYRKRYKKEVRCRTHSQENNRDT